MDFIIVIICLIGKLGLREVQGLAQGDTFNKWQRWNKAQVIWLPILCFDDGLYSECGKYSSGQEHKL